MNGKKILKEILSTTLYLFGVVIITYILIHYVGQRTEVEGSSMEATLSDGDNLIVDKISYKFKDPQRFDIIVFPYEGQIYDTSETPIYYIKRIIGLPGETIQIDDEGTIYINGTVLEESYGLERIHSAGIASEPITLGDDEYFVMGDNRNDSRDSRFADVGNIKRSEIIGKAFIRIWPLSKLSILKHQ